MVSTTHRERSDRCGVPRPQPISFGDSHPITAAKPYRRKTHSSPTESQTTKKSPIADTKKGTFGRERQKSRLNTIKIDNKIELFYFHIHVGEILCVDFIFTNHWIIFQLKLLLTFVAINVDSYFGRFASLGNYVLYIEGYDAV